MKPALVVDGVDIEQLTSEELATRAVAGSEDCFSELVRRHSAALFRFLQRKVPNRQDAEDLTQETFIRVHQKLDRFDPAYRFKTWLFTIGARLSYSHFRKRYDKPVAEVEAQVDVVNPAMILSSEEEAENIWASVHRNLPARQAKALWLRYGQGLSVKETAQQMVLSTVHVKVLLHRGRSRMAALIKHKKAAGSRR